MSSFITFLTECNMLPLNENVSYSLYSTRKKKMRKKMSPKSKNCNCFYLLKILTSYSVAFKNYLCSKNPLFPKHAMLGANAY